MPRMMSKRITSRWSPLVFDLYGSLAYYISQGSNCFWMEGFISMVMGFFIHIGYWWSFYFYFWFRLSRLMSLKTFRQKSCPGFCQWRQMHSKFSEERQCRCVLSLSYFKMGMGFSPIIVSQEIIFSFSYFWITSLIFYSD